MSDPMEHELQAQAARLETIARKARTAQNHLINFLVHARDLRDELAGLDWMLPRPEPGEPRTPRAEFGDSRTRTPRAARGDSRTPSAKAPYP